MASPWYKRLFAWFSSNDQTEEEKQEPEVYYSVPPSSKSRVIFRFPVVPDEEFNQPVKQQPLAKAVEDGGSVVRRKQEVAEQRNEDELLIRNRERLNKERDKLYQEKGWLKKAQEVPSPIHGFNRPPEVNEHSTTLLDEETKEIVSLEFVESVAPASLIESEIGDLPPSAEDRLIEHRLENDLLEHDHVDDDYKDVEHTRNMEDADDIENTDGLVDDGLESTEFSDQSEMDRPTLAEAVPLATPNVESSFQKDAKPMSRIPYNVFYFGQQGKDVYHFPKLQFLKPSPPVTEDDKNWQAEMVDNLEQTLLSFNVQAKVVGITRGPTVTRIEIQPAPGVKVNRITNLSDDIKLNLAAKDIRIEAPVPGKSAVGIEVPNLVREPVNIVDILASSEFGDSKSPLSVALGKDIEGKPVVIDLRKMPHGLIAGSTGSGKSVCINSIIISLLYKAKPEEVKMILIDPKMVELAPYHDLPHLATPVVTDPKQATMALKWAVEEMDRRYELFAASGVRDIGRYNQLMVETNPDVVKPALPYLLIVIDELADLMMVAPGDVEESIARIAQKARACGIHLLVATQRPSVDVITGMIKANIPTRIAFSVSSQVDSRTILDSVGAERLLGRGDMLLMENGSNKAVRLQGNFVADEEIEAVCNFVRSQRKPKFLFDKESLVKSLTEEPEDDLFKEALQFVVEQETASTSLLQRKFRIGYNRAARLIDMMEERGMISEAAGSKPRNVLVTQEEYEALAGG